MIRRWAIVIVILGVIQLTSSFSALEAQRGSARRPTDVQAWHLGSPTAETIEERLESVDAVVVATIVSGPTTRMVDIRASLERQNRGAVLPQPVVAPVTEYQLQVNEVVRGHASVVVGTPLRMARVGGRVELSDHDLVANTRIPALAAGTQYLILLEYNKTFEMFMYSVEDLFRLDGPRVRIDSLSTRPAYAGQLDGKDSAEVLTRVRAAIAVAPNRVR